MNCSNKTNNKKGIRSKEKLLIIEWKISFWFLIIKNMYTMAITNTGNEIKKVFLER